MKQILHARAIVVIQVILLTACAAPAPQEAPVEDRQANAAEAEQRAVALAEAEAALARGDAPAARFYLDQARPPSGKNPPARYQQALAELLALEADPVGQALAQAAATIEVLDPYDTLGGVSLMQAFEGVPSARLEALSQASTPLGTWSALALSVRRDLIANAELLSAANAWQSAHPGHPVQAPEYMELCWQYRQQFQPPARIAVLLPLEGSLGAAAEAIRDGMLTAWLDRPGAAQLDFMPVGDEAESALSAYHQAAQSGYQWVIGPLRRESTQLIAELEQPPVPVLLLNDPPNPVAPSLSAPQRVFSLSLSQQAEAQALARRLLELGYQRAMVLAADDSWGQGVEQAFIDAYQAGQGEVIAIARFPTTQSDHSELLTSVLRIEDSLQRKAQLQSALGLVLEFEPSRRDDFDVIFLAADPVLGRQLKPQLRFFDTGSKPMYAMSRIFSGQVDAGADQDLNGIWFAATRAALPDKNQATALASARGGAFASLQALGADAWGVLPWLGLMQRDPDLVYPGDTGNLTILADGSLHREPLWLRFEKGRPGLPDTASTP